MYVARAVVLPSNCYTGCVVSFFICLLFVVFLVLNCRLYRVVSMEFSHKLLYMNCLSLFKNMSPLSGTKCSVERWTVPALCVRWCCWEKEGSWEMAGVMADQLVHCLFYRTWSISHLLFILVTVLFPTALAVMRSVLSVSVIWTNWPSTVISLRVYGSWP